MLHTTKTDKTMFSTSSKLETMSSTSSKLEAGTQMAPPLILFLVVLTELSPLQLGFPCHLYFQKVFQELVFSTGKQALSPQTSQQQLLHHQGAMSHQHLSSRQPRRSHSGLMQPCPTRYLICSSVPPPVALQIAHAASFCISNSAV